MAPVPDAFAMPSIPETPLRLRPWHALTAGFAIAALLLVGVFGGRESRELSDEVVEIVVEDVPAPAVPPETPEPPPPPRPNLVDRTPADPDAPPRQAPDEPSPAQFGLPEEALGDGGDMAVATGNSLMAASDSLVRPSPPSAPPPMDLASLRSSYLDGLRRLLEERKCYPAMARRLKQQGCVRVGFSILADGRLEAAQVTRGSRFDVLDRAAVETVLAVGSYRPIPPALGMERWDVEIPIAYRLD